jgi:predicted alpha/beta-fold hydrolase
LVGDLQTIRNAVLRDHAKLGAWHGTRLTFTAENGDRLEGVMHRVPDTDKPLVVLVHGLTGCEDSAYVRASARHLLQAGFDVFRFNLRGAGPSRPNCREMYHAGRSGDLRLVLETLHGDGHSPRGICAMGYSLGGNLLLKYLGESGENALVARAISVSAPLDLAAASRRLEAPRNRGYHRWLLDRMKSDWRGGPLDMTDRQRDALESARTIREFDNGVVAPLNGFADAADYYARNMSARFLKHIAVPSLLLHGDTDPWIPAGIYREVDGLPDNLRVMVARGGGHVGFHGRDGRWHDRCAVAFFQAGI